MHYIYFGTNKTAVNNADSTSPELICELNAPVNIVNLPKELMPEMTYYWRVDSSKVIKDKYGNLSASELRSHETRTVGHDIVIIPC